MRCPSAVAMTHIRKRIRLPYQNDYILNSFLMSIVDRMQWGNYCFTSFRIKTLASYCIQFSVVLYQLIIYYLKNALICLFFGFFFFLQLKEEVTIVADKKTSYLTWVGLGLMGVQFGVLARLTWWEYSWDIMEPVTYFVTYGTAMAAYAYYCLTKQVNAYSLMRSI